LGNTKNLENEKDVKCPLCGADSTATGLKTPDGRPMYCCSREACGAEFPAEDWLTCPSCKQQGELTNEVSEDGFQVCLCKNPGCTINWFPGQKVEEVQVSSRPHRLSDVCPTCGKPGKKTGEATDLGWPRYICENDECPEKDFLGLTETVGPRFRKNLGDIAAEEVTAEAKPVFDWRNRLDVFKEIMEGCMAAAVQIIPGDVDPDEEFSAIKYGALCHTRSDCALALFRVLTQETARIMEVLDKAAAMLEESGKNQRPVDIMLLPKGLIPMPPSGEQC